MHSADFDYTTKQLSRQPATSITELAIVPALIEKEGPDTKRRFVEFFTANISNPNTRAAYLRAVVQFCEWCGNRNLSLHQTEPTPVALYIAEPGQTYSLPTVKQHLAAIRMLLDFFVNGGILKSNPASSVRGPRHVVVKGKTPVLQPADARQQLNSIPSDTS